MIGYRIGRAVVWAAARVLWRIRILGADRLPGAGGYVIAPSHRSFWDAFFAGLITPRRVRFMAKAELWRSRLLGRVVEYFGAFPVERTGTDRAALRTAMACIEAGEPLVIFPEGTRRRGPRIEDLHDGAAYVAARLGVPIVPVGIGGSEEIMPKGKKVPRLHRCVVVVGEPLEPPRRDGAAIRRSEVKALTGDLEVALQKVFDEARALAGVA